MAWTTVPDVDNGASFGDAATNAYRNGIMEIQVALDPVRRRDQRTTTTYTVGDTDLIATSTVESVGGITIASGVYTLPVDGVYSMTIVFNVAATHGTDDYLGGAVNRAGSPFFLNRRPLQDTSTGNIESWTCYMYATDTVKFTVTVATASFDAAWETQVALLSHVLP